MWRQGNTYAYGQVIPCMNSPEVCAAAARGCSIPGNLTGWAAWHEYPGPPAASPLQRRPLSRCGGSG